ncbi:hypothetical protein [Bacillus suaedaesalsae]|uniref:PhoD-like phosphatase metallophosphatase domain-containing protein n=1 Tax=Bacillus suaedaesalsae TaxID=2810349 RepID=A0ABS2DKH0_9BACI|nr:hypothetical protein [Bacillus suaedaesalsae]MBM6618933.1 hypothetical protein [Bacillus suaedaesalsae]
MKLPTILSGPILRKVDSTGIHIWLATSFRLQMKGELYQIHQKEDSTYSYQLLSNHSEVKTIHLGKNLYMNLVKISPVTKSFPSDVLLGYNLLFSNGTKVFDLSDYGLLTPNSPDSIVYGELLYPSFFINSSENSTLLYGSCRKFHGKGNDTLVSGDLLLLETYLDLEKRPHSLFLLGDQIYADDVADPLFSIITKLSKKLIGKREVLSNLDQRLKDEPFSTSINQINGRQFIMKNFCSFTSSSAQNHLMKFGEFAAMYLLSFSPALWEYLQANNMYPTFEEEVANNNVYYMFPNTEPYASERLKEHQKLEARYNEHWEDIQSTITNFTNVRRLLANTPTYMIFDDHDITDDWNLSADWETHVSESPLGSHVVTNGLAAYWAFQGFGNSPEDFDASFLRTMTRYFKKFTVNSSTYHQWKELLTNFQSWHFVAPTVPKTLFLDTRTRRDFDFIPKPIKIGNMMEENLRGPILISDHGWHDLTKSLVKSGWRGNQPLAIASPTPLYGIGLIESVLNSYVYPMRALGIPVDHALDYEAWKYNGKGFSEFLRHIFTWKPSTCIILSGDVHYASSLRTTVQSQSGEEATILQFTSSPIKNMSFAGIWGFLMKSAIWFNTLKRKKKNLQRFCMNDYQMMLQNKNTKTPLLFHWKETIKYLSTSTDSIIETNNNIGLLSLTEHSAQNSLLSYRDFEKHETAFDVVTLKDGV